MSSGDSLPPRARGDNWERSGEGVKGDMDKGRT